MRRKLSILTLFAMLLALCVSAEAQQPKKISRIAYVTAAPLSAMEYRIEAFRQGLRELTLGPMPQNTAQRLFLEILRGAKSRGELDEDVG